MTKHFCDVCGHEMPDLDYVCVHLIPLSQRLKRNFNDYGCSVCVDCARKIEAFIDNRCKEEMK